MNEKEVTTYQMIQQGIDKRILQNLLDNKNITMLMAEKICRILKCDISAIVEFIDDNNWKFNFNKYNIENQHREEVNGMLLNDNEYLNVLENVKKQIQTSQHKAIVGANREMIILYWNIGKIINECTEWGNKFVDNLTRDIKLEFPNTTGYSVRNLKYMAQFARTYTNFEIMQRTVAQIPWRHNIALLDKVKDEIQRDWYVAKIIEHGWSRDVLVHQIETNLYHRQVETNKITNFNEKLQNPQSAMALQEMKDPYIFDFISSREDMVETDIEKELVKNITKLLLELGTGFAFIGNQYHLEVGDQD